MNNNLTISVLMSVYNNDNPQHLELSLKSIIETQILKPNEIVIIIDGPVNENILNIITSIKTSTTIPLVLHQLDNNVGLTKALNIGINLCSNELIARMDADDISLPNRFKLQHDFFVQHRNIYVLGGSIQEFDDNGKIGITRSYPSSNTEMLNSIAKMSPFAHPTVMFRKEVFEKGYLYNEKFRVSQDIELWFRILESGMKVANIPDVLLQYRLNENFAKRRSLQKSVKEFTIYWNGIKKLKLNLFYRIYPVLRLCTRLMPTSVTNIIYKSNLRKLLNK